jgi:hypothetical protein
VKEGFADGTGIDGCLTGNDGREMGLVEAQSGIGGGFIGFEISRLKRLDLRLLGDGDGGICDKVSIVLSERDGRGFRFVFGVSDWKVRTSGAAMTG